MHCWLLHYSEICRSQRTENGSTLQELPIGVSHMDVHMPSSAAPPVDSSTGVSAVQRHKLTTVFVGQGE